MTEITLFKSINQSVCRSYCFK